MKIGGIIPMRGLVLFIGKLTAFFISLLESTPVAMLSWAEEGKRVDPCPIGSGLSFPVTANPLARVADVITLILHL